jgi:hypothetical protein
MKKNKEKNRSQYEYEYEFILTHREYMIKACENSFNLFFIVYIIFILNYIQSLQTKERTTFEFKIKKKSINKHMI